MRKCNQKIRTISEVIVEIIVIFMFIITSVSALSSAMLFYPHFDEESYNKLQEEEKAEALTVNIDGTQISGWMIHNAQDEAPIILYFAGNGENSSTRALRLLMNANECEPFANYNIIIYDYPGYGKSSGYPSESSFKQHGLKVYDWVRENYQNSRIILMGYSIGTGVTNYVASERQVDGMILMAPYADGYDLFNNQIGMFYGPLKLLVTYKMEAIKFAENIEVCPLILASDKDELVPYESSSRLSKAYPCGSEFITIKDISHNEFWSNEEALECIDNYLEEIQ
jgi:pimeloyl-ACP methyl ester carboxylesterase